MRLIDADALIKEANADGAYGYVGADEIADAPTIEAEPVRHGRWVPVSHDGYADGLPVYDEWECSECRFEVKGEGEPPLNYCPMCGSKMDGGDEDGEY